MQSHFTAHFQHQVNGSGRTAPPRKSLSSDLSGVLLGLRGWRVQKPRWSRALRHGSQHSVRTEGHVWESTGTVREGKSRTLAGPTARGSARRLLDGVYHLPQPGGLQDCQRVLKPSSPNLGAAGLGRWTAASYQGFTEGGTRRECGGVRSESSKQGPSEELQRLLNLSSGDERFEQDPQL